MKNDARCEKVFDNTFAYKLIYIFTIPDEYHDGKVKVGDASVELSSPNVVPNDKRLREAAKNRINEYTQTAGILYDLRHAEIAIDKNGKSFRDYDVHAVLKNSGIKQVQIGYTRGKEWFETDVPTARMAIEMVKEGKSNLSGQILPKKAVQIMFRPEQREAIEKTLRVFKNGKRMLWNAKMRFGKTLCAMEVVKRSDEAFKGRSDRFKKVLIITHRPVVDEGWYGDFEKIFASLDAPHYKYGSKVKGESLQNLLNGKENFVYFASIQDLRGSEIVGGQLNKDSEIFSTDWDLLIVDEAHEGTTTDLGRSVIKELSENEKTKVLSLSGTPFNIIDDYTDEEIYTWDYIDEQEAKLRWAIDRNGDSNPYEDLPKLNIYTYDLKGDLGDREYLQDKYFNFQEFFRLDKDANFVHAKDIEKFLDLMTRKNEKNNYPYSKDEYRTLFQHSLWIVPGVKEAKALKKLMLCHPAFGSGAFNIINVAGEGDEEREYASALEEVQEAIKKADSEGLYTITLSCGRLTTGVTVPEWTAVFLLAGSSSTSASSYLQTIFRVQSPCTKNGQRKQNCYVFDFAPDRTLKMIASSIVQERHPGREIDDHKRIKQFLQYCPVISMSGSNMRKYDEKRMFRQLKQAYIDRVVSNGFEDIKLYKSEELLKINELDLRNFNNLQNLTSTGKPMKKNLLINDQGLDHSDVDIELPPKTKRELTSEELEEREEHKRALKLRNSAIAILKAISIRMPLLVYGLEGSPDLNVTLDKFVDNIDDESWQEFMPEGVTKDIFRSFTKYYDEDVFMGASHRIREISKEADELDPTRRVEKIAGLFSTFKNPDKETVLTPWSVVNMHMSDTLGGWEFSNAQAASINSDPIFVDQGHVTANVFGSPDSKILEINSKSGLYCLYAAYSLYRRKSNAEESTSKSNNVWKDVVENNIYAICKTRMAKQILKRTLAGYRNINVNARYFDNLPEKFRNKEERISHKIVDPKTWGKKGEFMKFNAVVGNPPYSKRVGTEGNKSLSIPLYPYFIMGSINLNPDYVSLITPSRWFTGKGQNGSFLPLRRYMRERERSQKWCTSQMRMKFSTLLLLRLGE